MKFRDITPFGVRFPTELKMQIQKSAAKNRRSMNAEIITQMQGCYSGPAAETKKAPLEDFSDGELIDELINRWGRDRVSIRLGETEK